MGCRSASSVGLVLTRRVSTEGPSALCPWRSRSISAPSLARSPRPRSRPQGSSAVRHRSAARCRSSPVSLAAAPQYASPWRSTARTLRTSSRRSSRCVRRAGGGRRAAHGTAGWPSTDSHFGRQFRLVRGWRRRWRRRRCTLSVRAMASAGILGGARQVTHAHRRARDGGEPSGRLVCPVPDAETARRCGRG